MNCIKTLRGGKKKSASVGNLILVTAYKLRVQKKIKKKTIYLGLIMSVSSWISRKDGVSFKFFSNRVLVFTKQYKFLGTRVYGVSSKELYHCNSINRKDLSILQKIVSYSPLLV